MSADMKVLSNHIYEYDKGVRPLVLYTCNKRMAGDAVERLERSGIDYIMQTAGRDNVNLFFGSAECLNAIRLIANKQLNKLTPEEDFILGALLGYDIRRQCERFCKRKHANGGCDGC